MKKLFFRIFRKKIDEYRDFSIQKKISVAFVLLLVPLILFVLIWFVCALDATNRYDKVVRNTSIISEFNLDFKKNYDYKIYLITTGNRTYTDQNPEQDIRYAKDIIRRVKATTENSENKECIVQIERYFQVLEKYTKTIQENMQKEGKYDENRDLWENGVQLVTANIQNKMLQLLYNENRQSALIYSDMQHITRNMIIISLFLAAFLAVVTTMMITIIPRSISKPVRYLSSITKKVADGNLEVRAHMEHGVDVKLLADSLNVMIEKIKTLIDNVMLEQMRLREAELEILQMQINPHFLYNTLDTIVWLAEAGQKEQVVSMVQTLSDFFRASLNSGKDIVSLEGECRHITSYLQIQQVRYQDILTYDVDIPEEIANCKIPKITLQPLVENSIKYGFCEIYEGGQIRIHVYKQDGRLILSVYNSGIPIAEEMAEKISADIGDETITLICILKGSVFLSCELAKNIKGSVMLDFMSVTSYGDDTKSSGVVKIIKDLDDPLEGKNVLVVEDIIDSGRTLSYLLKNLKARNPKSLRLCTLLDKPDRRVVDVSVDYVGFEIPDEFVVGFGLDYAQRYRNLPYIGVLEFNE